MEAGLVWVECWRHCTLPLLAHRSGFIRRAHYFFSGLFSIPPCTLITLTPIPWIAPFLKTFRIHRSLWDFAHSVSPSSFPASFMSCTLWLILQGPAPVSLLWKDPPHPPHPGRTNPIICSHGILYINKSKPFQTHTQNIFRGRKKLVFVFN